MSDFPQRIYLKWETPGRGETAILLVETDSGELPIEEVCAVYERTGLVRPRVVVEPVPLRAKRKGSKKRKKGKVSLGTVARRLADAARTR
jgi:hypothetical protein